jgi:ketosteroid isomerase-like protein
MKESVSSSVVQAFYQAFAERDPLRMAPLLADEVEWTIPGPISVFPFCGHRRGKAAVIDYIARLVPSMFSVKQLEPEERVIDGNVAAVLANMCAVQKDTGRTIVYHVAHFFTFRDDKAVAVISMADTFDAAEQFVGHRINAQFVPEAEMPVHIPAKGMVVL